MDDDVSQVIERTSVIENLLDQIITKYINPRKEVHYFFHMVMLDGSILELGKKSKLVKNIARALNYRKKLQPVDEIIKYRNAFAHHSLFSHPTLVVGKSQEENKAVYLLQIMSSTGGIKRVSREDALREFNKNFVEAKDTLKELLKVIDAINSD